MAASSVNVFKYCTGLKILGSFMVLIVLSIVGVSYYAVVICTYGPDLLLGGWTSCISLLVLLLFHSLLAMLLWCYFATVLTDPGGVPEDWTPFAKSHLDLEAGEKLPQASGTRAGLSPGDHPGGGEDDPSTALMKDERDLGLGSAQPHQGGAGASPMGMGMGNSLSREMGPASVEVRRCKKCLQYKPPRTHHCSVCRRCILKMDHHCVWVVNCVGARNYKSFLLFMGYTFLECLLVCLALLPRFISFFAQNLEGDVQEPGKLAAVFLAFVLNFAFTLSLLGFLAMHVSLVFANTTTIEAFEKSKAGSRSKYDVGRQRNLEQVMGRDRRYWLLPCYSPEDLKNMPELTGLEYPARTPSERQLAQHHNVRALSLD